MRKQLDPRIPILINNNVKKNHRSFIVLVGDKGRDQVCHPTNMARWHLVDGGRLLIYTFCFLKRGSLHDRPCFGVTRRSSGSRREFVLLGYGT